MDRFDYSRIPDHMMKALKGYIDHGRPVGHFLKSILINDLYGAVKHADDVNTEIIPIYVCYLYNEAPGACWGSPEIVNEWLTKKHIEVNHG